MTDEQYIWAFKKLDTQFEFHLKLWRLEEKLKLAEAEKDKQLIKKQISQIEQLKRMSNL